MRRVEASEPELVGKFTEILHATPSLMRVLTVARGLDLPDWLVFSGAAYQPALNHLTGRAPDYGVKDYDLAYFDGLDLSSEAEDAIIRRVKGTFEEPLRSMVEVRNQARVHRWFEAHFGEPYSPLSCTADAIERFTSPTLEREVDGPGVVGRAHPACYVIWREESAALRQPPPRRWSTTSSPRGW